jgi:hypothetical protein
MIGYDAGLRRFTRSIIEWVREASWNAGDTKMKRTISILAAGAIAGLAMASPGSAGAASFKQYPALSHGGGIVEVRDWTDNPQFRHDQFDNDFGWNNGRGFHHRRHFRRHSRHHYNNFYFGFPFAFAPLYRGYDCFRTWDGQLFCR